MLKRIENYASKFMIAMFISFSYIYAVTTAMNLKYSAAGIILLVIAFLALCSLVSINRLSLKITGITAGAALLGLGYYFYRNYKILKEIIDHVSTFVRWTYDYLNFKQPFNTVFSQWLVYLLCFAVSTLIFIFTIKRFSFFILLISGCTIFVSQWMFAFMNSLVPFFMYLFAIIICYFYFVYRGYSLKNPDNYASPGTFIFWSAPLCIIIIALSYSLPSSTKPIEWPWLDSKINNVYTTVYHGLTYGSTEYFSIKATGFGAPAGSLGGKVSLDNTLVLKVKSPMKLYLKGTTRDIYTGSSWIMGEGNLIEPKDSSNLYESNMEKLEMYEGVKLLTRDDNFAGKYYVKGEVEVEYQSMSTKSLFMPIKTVLIKPDSNLRIYEDTNGNVSSAKSLGKNISYSLESIFVKYGDKGFLDALRLSRRGLYSDYLSALQSPARFRRMQSLDSEVAANLAQYSINIYNRYLQLPDNLPPRVSELAKSITSAAKNNYDKVSAIENYLSSKFPYSLEPDQTPKDRDFVDYFLFDLKKGYCTYYASAMVIMARSLGIPARYVEGYMLPNDKNSDLKYDVTNNQAHAWAEVYFEGFGWIPFEPTAPFRVNFYENSRTFNSANSGSDLDPAYDEYLQYMEEYNERNASLNLNNLPDGTEKSPGLTMVLLVLCAALLVVLIVMSFFNTFRRNLRLFKISKMPPSKCVLLTYKRFVKVLSLQRLAIKPGETADQYAERVDVVMLFNRPDFKSVTDIFVKARYSNFEVSEQEKAFVLNFSEYLIYESRKNLGKFRFFVLNRILGLI